MGKTSVRTTETSKLPCGREDREETNSTLPTASENIIGLRHCTLLNDMLKSNHWHQGQERIICWWTWLLGLVRNGSPSIVCYLTPDRQGIVAFATGTKGIAELAHDI